MVTGDLLAVDALDDGYVHMKWAIFTDTQGHRLYASGSLNESRTALSLNAENIDVHCDWQGETDRRRVEEAAGEYEALWDNRHPAFKVLTLPEAVRHAYLLPVPDERPAASLYEPPLLIISTGLVARRDHRRGHSPEEPEPLAYHRHAYAA